ncbi:MAG: putative metal-binding motif-containing protein, partial [Myxococcales bacterium]|nr:putative metal-binding motif-containing protein [Myxococcales bacterium]
MRPKVQRQFDPWARILRGIPRRGIRAITLRFPVKPLSRFGPCGRTVAFALAAFAVALVGCGDDAVPSVDGGEDGGTEGGLSFCSTDDDCNDGIACTTEFCNDLGVCQFRPDHSQCSDDVFCNGEEVCSLTEGCIPAYRTACNDNDVCTIDECDEEAAQCTHAPRDIDGDGDPDSHCANGGDCDDRDPRRASTFSEVCTDLVDNDCDGLVDEPECGAPPGDTCDTAIDVSGGGLFELYLDGAARDYSASCVPAGGRDLAFSFTLTEPMDVDIAASGIGTSSVALFAECGDLETEFECDRAVRAEVRARALPAGTYGGVVFSSATGLSSDEPTVVTVDLAPATDPPANEACGGAEEILSSGVVHGSLVDVSSDLSTACFAGNTPDLVYFITTDAPHDIQLTATSSDGSPLAIETRTTCDDVDSSLRCVRGIPADTRLYSVPAGTYYFIVESAAGAEPDFDLKVEVLEPTMPPAGDVCDTAIAIPVGMTVTGTLAGAQDDHTVSCGLPYRDVVYTFELDAPKDVFVQVDSGNTFAYAAVSNDCGNIAAER